MGDAMKLDKWPEEIECDGWRWVRDYIPTGIKLPSAIVDMLPPGCYYRRVEKLHVPPTIKEMFQHLIDGGWVKAEYKDTIAYWRIDKHGSKELQVAFYERGTLLRFKKSCDFTFAYTDMKVTLCKSGVEDVYVGSTYVGSK